MASRDRLRDRDLVWGGIFAVCAGDGRHGSDAAFGLALGQAASLGRLVALVPDSDPAALVPGGLVGGHC